MNEDGFFKTEFAKEMDSNQPYTVDESVYSGKSQKVQEKLAQVRTLGEIFEKGKVEFRPDGTAVYSWKMNDEVNKMLFGDDMMSMLLHPAQIELDCTYTVDVQNSQICMVQVGGGLSFIFIMDLDKETIHGTYNFPDEPFTVDGEVDEKVVNYTVMKDIAYGSDPRQVMDIYLPKDYQASEKNGAFISVYGGGWTSGNKEDATASSHAMELANRGYLAVTISMRNVAITEDNNSSINTVYDMVNDVQGSVSKLKELSDEMQWGISQIALVGGSSGANVSMLYSYSRSSELQFSFDTFDTREVLPVRFVVDVVGPIDMHDEYWVDDEWPAGNPLYGEGYGPYVAMLMTGGLFTEGIEENPQLADEYINSVSPMYYVKNGQGIPTILSYGGRDISQNPNNGFYLEAALKEKGIDNYLFYSPNVGHEVDPDGLDAFYAKIKEFADRYFTAPDNKDNKNNESNKDYGNSENDFNEDTTANSDEEAAASNAGEQKAPVSPKTGDDGCIGWCIILSITACCGLLISINKSRRRNR